MPDLHDQFHAAAEEYANRLAAEREARENPRKTTANNAAAFAEHLEQQLEEQRANGMRIDTTNL